MAFSTRWHPVRVASWNGALTAFPPACLRTRQHSRQYWSICAQAPGARIAVPCLFTLLPARMHTSFIDEHKTCAKSVQFMSASSWAWECAAWQRTVAASEASRFCPPPAKGTLGFGCPACSPCRVECSDGARWGKGRLQARGMVQNPEGPRRHAPGTRYTSGGGPAEARGAGLHPFEGPSARPSASPGLCEAAAKAQTKRRGSGHFGGMRPAGIRARPNAARALFPHYRSLHAFYCPHKYAATPHRAPTQALQVGPPAASPPMPSVPCGLLS